MENLEVSNGPQPSNGLSKTISIQKDGDMTETVKAIEIAGAGCVVSTIITHTADEKITFLSASSVFVPHVVVRTNKEDNTLFLG